MVAAISGFLVNNIIDLSRSHIICLNVMKESGRYYYLTIKAAIGYGFYCKVHTGFL